MVRAPFSFFAGFKARLIPTAVQLTSGLGRFVTFRTPNPTSGPQRLGLEVLRHPVSHGFAVRVRVGTVVVGCGGGHSPVTTRWKVN